jgi:hypothetical protein
MTEEMESWCIIGNTNHPIVSYLVAFSITNYASYEEFVHLPMGLHPGTQLCYPENVSVQKQDSRHPNMMQFYNEKFGLYPFADEKFGTPI